MRTHELTRMNRYAVDIAILNRREHQVALEFIETLVVHHHKWVIYEQVYMAYNHTMFQYKGV